MKNSSLLLNPRILLYASMVLIFVSANHAQEAQFPIVKGYGGIYEIPSATAMPTNNKDYKIIIELASKDESPEDISAWLNNVARTANLHGLGGIPAERIDIKVIVHGPALYSLLTDDRYLKEMKVARNPNTPLLEALQAAGIVVLVCGQSLRARKVEPTELLAGTEISLSALTTITDYVSQGYVFFKFSN